jgi:dihydropteroate synthase
VPARAPFPGLDPRARLYLNPLGLGRRPQGGAALPLAGGPLWFTSFTIILAAGGKRVYEAAFPVASWPKLRETLPPYLRPRFDDLFSNLTAPRPPLGKLAFGRPLVMGVLNVTPDSFSDGGDFLKGKDALSRARELVRQGADILDAGAESTRPGSNGVPAATELKRLAPVLKEIRKIKIPVSVDTRKSAVMIRALTAGAKLINDVSAFRHDRKSLSVLKNAKAGIILMHAKGTPATMQKDPRYADVVLEVFDFLEKRIEVCGKGGISKNRMLADPGFGFGKTTAHNLALLQNLALFHGLGVPLVAGLSRKRFLGELAGEKDPRKRLAPSLAAAVAAAGQGVQVIRCHDVAETRRALAIAAF